MKDLCTGMWHIVARQFVAVCKWLFDTWTPYNRTHYWALRLQRNMQSSTPTLSNATRLNMQRLVMLRSVMIACISTAIIGLTLASIPLPLVPLLLAISGLGFLNFLGWWRLRRHPHTTQGELFTQLLGDLTALSVLFYFSGGYSNPFIWMYLIPITVAAVA